MRTPMRTRRARPSPSWRLTSAAHRCEPPWSTTGEQFCCGVRPERQGMPMCRQPSSISSSRSAPNARTAPRRMRSSACPAPSTTTPDGCCGRPTCPSAGPTSCPTRSCRPVSGSAPTSPTTPTSQPWARPCSGRAGGSPTSPSSPSRRASAPASSTTVASCVAAGRWPRWATPSSTGKRGRRGYHPRSRSWVGQRPRPHGP